jgi:hypothetical protein
MPKRLLPAAAIKRTATTGTDDSWQPGIFAADDYDTAAAGADAMAPLDVVVLSGPD